MENKDIIEGNKAIAEFMGVEPAKDGMVNIYMDGEEMKEFGQEYHSSWDWLRSPIMKAHDVCKLYSEGLKFFDGLTIFSTIQQVWQALVDFINWYNKKKSNG